MITLIKASQSIINFIELALGNYYFLFAITSLLIILKATLLLSLILRGTRSSKTYHPWIFLIFVLIGSIFENISWIIKLLQLTIIPSIDLKVSLLITRIAWGFTVIQYQAFALFIESLFQYRFSLNLRQKLFLTISSLLFILFLILAISSATNPVRPKPEFLLFKSSAIYLLFPLMLSAIFITFKKTTSANLPKILKKQFSVLIKMVVLPWWLCDLLQVYPFNFTPGYIASSYAAIGISNILLTYVIYYSARKVTGLRFLNFNSHVQAQVKHSFIDNFKELLEQLSQATNTKELVHITQTYFKEGFAIPIRNTMLYLRTSTIPENEYKAEQNFKNQSIQTEVESFLTTSDASVQEAIRQAKILIYDEITFSNFYEKNPVQTSIISFLDAINADIFLPIYEKQKLIAYIIINRNARAIDQFYSDMERDEMIVFVSYLSNIIHLLLNRNLENLILKEKELKEELYYKHQEINQYKESIRSFLHTNSQKRIGIIFYKNRKFIFGNQAAKELVKININAQEGHPLTQALKKLARQVEDYRSPQSYFTKDNEGNSLVFNGVLNLEQNNIIISVYRPEISDIITKQLDQLKDPSKWDYLLYLETTRSGQLINKLIPGSGETLLECKIFLLKAALSKKAVLLEMAKEDLLPTVEILHHISLGDNLYTLNLQAPEKNCEIATKVFGINPLFDLAKKPEDPLLKKLSPNGTLFIKNIQFLDHETQEYLAEFIRYGFFRTFKSDQKHPAHVRIICSSNYNLHNLTYDGKFSRALFNELKQTTLIMPSLLTLPEKELHTLAEGFSEQALKAPTFKNLLELSIKDKSKLTCQRPISLHELKIRVQQLLVQKSKKNTIYNETQFDPAYEISDPELMQAARLGKQALRDPKMMALLWKKFKNQTKIATFLGVNRSSVNRRCKKYNLV